MHLLSLAPNIPCPAIMMEKRSEEKRREEKKRRE
jgi:hypothetical protein